MPDYEKSIEEIEREIDRLGDRELEEIINPQEKRAPKPAIALSLPTISAPKISLFNLVFFPAMAVCAGTVAWGFAMLLSNIWLPWTVDKAAYDLAAQRSRQGVPTRVEYCADSDFGGRNCTLQNNRFEIQKVVIRGDR